MSGLTPTAAAMRAANALTRRIKDAEHRARTIEHHTGLPELIAACEAAEEFIGSIHPGKYNENKIWQDLYDALQIAREGRK